MRSHEFGRLAMNIDGDPVIFPVNYVIDGDTVAMRTDPGSAIEASIMERVAFEVDHVDPESGEGWSVVIRGIARQITDAIDAPSEHTRMLRFVPWAPGPKPEWIKIMDTAITGRRLVRPPWTAPSGVRDPQREGDGDRATTGE